VSQKSYRILRDNEKQLEIYHINDILYSVQCNRSKLDIDKKSEVNLKSHKIKNVCETSISEN